MHQQNRHINAQKNFEPREHSGWAVGGICQIFLSPVHFKFAQVEPANQHGRGEAAQVPPPKQPKGKDRTTLQSPTSTDLGSDAESLRSAPKSVCLFTESHS